MEKKEQYEKDNVSYGDDMSDLEAEEGKRNDFPIHAN